VEQQMAAMGMAVSSALCEHFAYTRQELEHMIRTESILNLNQLLERHGQGMGCDICKPTAANSFASVQNDFVLSADHLGLQDTNAACWANLHKHRRDCVVPRTAASALYPHVLIRVGEVGRGSRRYSKITGGRRNGLCVAKL